MEQDTEFTPVVFRAERSGQFKGDITAVMPCEPADHNGHNMTCYEHIGQHSACGWEWYHSTRAAKPEEYASLLAELKSIGYRPKVYKRIQPWMRDEFRRALASLTTPAM